MKSLHLFRKALFDIKLRLERRKEDQAALKNISAVLQRLNPMIAEASGEEEKDSEELHPAIFKSLVQLGLAVSKLSARTNGLRLSHQEINFQALMTLSCIFTREENPSFQQVKDIQEDLAALEGVIAALAVENDATLQAYTQLIATHTATDASLQAAEAQLAELDECTWDARCVTPGNDFAALQAALEAARNTTRTDAQKELLSDKNTFKKGTISKDMMATAFTKYRQSVENSAEATAEKEKKAIEGKKTTPTVPIEPELRGINALTNAFLQEKRVLRIKETAEIAAENPAPTHLMRALMIIGECAKDLPNNLPVDLALQAKYMQFARNSIAHCADSEEGMKYLAALEKDPELPALIQTAIQEFAAGLDHYTPRPADSAAAAQPDAGKEAVAKKLNEKKQRPRFPYAFELKEKQSAFFDYATLFLKQLDRAEAMVMADGATNFMMEYELATLGEQAKHLISDPFFLNECSEELIDEIDKLIEIRNQLAHEVIERAVYLSQELVDCVARLIKCRPLLSIAQRRGLAKKELAHWQKEQSGLPETGRRILRGLEPPLKALKKAAKQFKRGKQGSAALQQHVGEHFSDPDFLRETVPLPESTPDDQIARAIDILRTAQEEKEEGAPSGSPACISPAPQKPPAEAAPLTPGEPPIGPDRVAPTTPTEPPQGPEEAGCSEQYAQCPRTPQKKKRPPEQSTTPETAARIRRTTPDRAFGRALRQEKAGSFFSTMDTAQKKFTAAAPSPDKANPRQSLTPEKKLYALRKRRAVCTRNLTEAMERAADGLWQNKVNKKEFNASQQNPFLAVLTALPPRAPLAVVDGNSRAASASAAAAENPGMAESARGKENRLPHPKMVSCKA